MCKMLRVLKAPFDSFRNQIWYHFAMLVVLKRAPMKKEIPCYPPSKRLFVVPREGFRAAAFQVCNHWRDNVNRIFLLGWVELGLV